MVLSPKVFLQQTNYREIACLWLALGSLLGILGLFIASLAIVWAIGGYQTGELSLWNFLLEMAIFASFVLSPMIGWVLFAKRLYRIAIVVGAFPIVLAGVGFASMTL